MKPISKLIPFQQQEDEYQSTERLTLLRKTLHANLATQEKLKKIRDQILARIHVLNEFISTYRLKVEYPPATSIMSYIKFERNVPHTFREQSKVMEQQEAIKNVHEDAFQFLNKLNETKSKKKPKEINFSELPSDPKKVNFAELSQSFQKKLGIQLYRDFLQFHKYKTKKRPFTNQEENFIVEKQRIYKDNWQKICQFMETRTFQEVYYEFHNRINPFLKSGRWSYRETIILIILIEHYGVKKWAQISQKLIVKSELQVRQRYCNIIDPQIGRNIWTEQTQQKLLQIVKDYNFSWKDIAKVSYFQNKTDNCIWRKFRNMMIKKQTKEIEDFMSGSGKKDLLKKIIQYKESNDLRKSKLEEKVKGKHQKMMLKIQNDKAQITTVVANSNEKYSSVQPSSFQKNVKINQQDNDGDVHYVIY